MDDAVSEPPRDGFTLIETVMALAVAAAIWGIVAVAIGTGGRTEAAARALFVVSRAARTVAAREASAAPDETPPLGLSSASPTAVPSVRGEGAWTSWRLSPEVGGAPRRLYLLRAP